MTTYVILRKTPGVEDGWFEVARRDARSDASAIRGHNPDGGVYVAVPVRSWRPRTVKADTKTVLTIT